MVGVMKKAPTRAQLLRQQGAEARRQGRPMDSGGAMTWSDRIAFEEGWRQTDMAIERNAALERAIAREKEWQAKAVEDLKNEIDDLTGKVGLGEKIEELFKAIIVRDQDDLP